MTRTLATIALTALIGAGAQAQGTVRLAVGADSKLWIEGRSNLSAWTCQATTVDAAIDVDIAFREARDLSRYLRSVHVRVPVANLKCGHDQMDKSVRAALDAGDSTQVPYILATFNAVRTESPESSIVHTAGTLTLAGREHSVTMDVDATGLGEGAVEARGVLPIRMSDYGIKPPTGMLGLVRAADRVVVNFALTLRPETIATVRALCTAASRE